MVFWASRVRSWLTVAGGALVVLAGMVVAVLYPVLGVAKSAKHGPIVEEAQALNGVIARYRSDHQDRLPNFRDPQTCENLLDAMHTPQVVRSYAEDHTEWNVRLSGLPVSSIPHPDRTWLFVVRYRGQLGRKLMVYVSGDIDSPHRLGVHRRPTAAVTLNK